MNKYGILTVIAVLAFIVSSATLNGQYKFKETDRVNCTPVKNQQRTGTCWSYATASLLESEIARMGHGDIDISEMYIVRNIYQDKATNYMLRQGKANFSQGSLSHDLVRMVNSIGLMPQDSYTGLVTGATGHDHSEMEAGLKGFLDGVNTQKMLSPRWMPAFNAVLDTYMGEVPDKVTYKGKSITPTEYASKLGIDSDNYVSFTSFTHHPFGSAFILEIPDNYSNGEFQNLKIDDLVSLTKNAIKAGYSITWDGDVSEKGFSAKNGIAVLPKDPKRDDLFTQPGEEVSVTQALRQYEFMSKSTTDDHLMHLVGMAQDQNGNDYFIIKNSWGEISDHKGFLYMSEAYFRMKTVAVMVHKDAAKKYIQD